MAMWNTGWPYQYTFTTRSCAVKSRRSASTACARTTTNGEDHAQSSGGTGLSVLAGYTSGLAVANGHGVVLGLLVQYTLRDNALTRTRATTIILAHKWFLSLLRSPIVFTYRSAQCFITLRVPRSATLAHPRSPGAAPVKQL
jgi:hypothetical protein